MLAAIFHGDRATLDRCRLDYLPSERTQWSVYDRRQLLTNNSRSVVTSGASSSRTKPLTKQRSMSVHSEAPSKAIVHRSIGDHPLMFQLTQNITTRQLIKAILLLLFGPSFLTLEEEERLRKERKAAATAAAAALATAGNGGAPPSLASTGPQPPATPRVDGRRQSMSTRQSIVRKESFSMFFNSVSKRKPSAAVDPTGQPEEREAKRRGGSMSLVLSSSMIGGAMFSGENGAGGDGTEAKVTAQQRSQHSNSREKHDTRPSADDVIPFESEDSVQHLDASQFLCHIFLPEAYCRQYPTGDEGPKDMDVKTAVAFFRSCRSLCQWTKWLLRSDAARKMNHDEQEQHFFNTLGDNSELSVPLMFPLEIASKVKRFLDRRRIGPQSITVHHHMLLSFLTDTFELAFTRDSVRRLLKAVESPDPDKLIETLDVWRYQDGVEHLCRVRAAYPTADELAHASPKEIVAVSQLVLPTQGHQDHLEIRIASLPRRTFASVVHALLNEPVPLGSTSQEHRSARLQREKQRSSKRDHFAEMAKYQLPPNWCPSPMGSDEEDIMMAAGQLDPDAEREEAQRKAREAAVVETSKRKRLQTYLMHRLSSEGAHQNSNLPQPEQSSTLEGIILRRHMMNPDNESVAQAMYNADIVEALQREDEARTREMEKKSVTDLRPLSAGFGVLRLSEISGATRPASGRPKAFAYSFLQGSRDRCIREGSRDVRALQRANRREIHIPTLDIPVPTATEIRKAERERLNNLFAAAPIISSAAVAGDESAGGIDGLPAQSTKPFVPHLTTEIPAEVRHKSDKELYELLYFGIEASDS